MSGTIAPLKLQTLSRTIACLGDSISARNNSAPMAGSSFSGSGFLAWAQIFLRNHVEFDGSLNFGVSGETSTQILARVSQVVAANPATCTVLAGTNDYSGVTDPNVTSGNLITILQILLAAGIRPIWLPILPRNIASQNAQFIAAVNWNVRTWCRENNVIISDVSPVWIDSTTGQPKANLTIDGLHPNIQGSILIGQVLANTLAQYLPQDDGLIYNPLDTFYTVGPVSNIWGALNPNPLTTGTSGTKFSGMTGNYLSSWNSQVVGGATWTGTINCTKETPADGLGEWQRVDFTNFVTASTSQVIQFYNLISPMAAGTVLAGTLFESLCEFEIVSNSGGLNCVSLATTDFDGSTNRGVQTSAGGTSTDTINAGTTFSGVLRTPVQAMRPNSGAGSSTLQTTIQPIINGQYSGGATFSIRWRRVSTRYRPA